MRTQPVKILHLTHALSLGGANRAIFGAAKYSAQLGTYRHSIAALLPGVPPGVQELANESAVSIVSTGNMQELIAAVNDCDILQLSWWNSPEMNVFLRQLNIPARVLTWLHVGGESPPQIVTDQILEFSDFAAATSPFCYQCGAIQRLSPEVRQERTGMIYGAADFHRLNNFRPVPHSGFHAGYIGTLDFGKLHRSFVPMNAGVSIPGFKLLVGGAGMNAELAAEAQSLNAADKFLFAGYVHDIRQMLELLDVYVLPLCKETYASSELNLQEAMYAAIPPVAFPHGGVRYLIEHEKTGLLVNNEREYQQALELLYHQPEYRRELGQRAHEYAQRVFGAYNAAIELNRRYELLLQHRKKSHAWNSTAEAEILTKVQRSRPELMPKVGGAAVFCASLGAHGGAFVESLCADELSALFAADNEIRQSTVVLRDSGINAYRGYFSTDPVLCFWSGLAVLNLNPSEAIVAFDRALQLGFAHPRIWGYIALAAKTLGIIEFSDQAWQTLMQSLPVEQKSSAHAHFSWS